MANLVFDFLHSYETGERRESEPANAYQYDEGHVLEAVLPEAVTSCEIHYWIRGQEKSEAYTPGSITQNDDGSCTVIGNIPNLYFETNGELRVYIVVTDGDASITTYEGFVHICQRSMPDDYVDDDPENEATRVLTEAQEAAATATAAAETCEEVRESIPEDYSQLSDDVSDLKDGLINNTSALYDAFSDLGERYDLEQLTAGTAWLSSAYKYVLGLIPANSVIKPVQIVTRNASSATYVTLETWKRTAGTNNFTKDSTITGKVVGTVGNLYKLEFDYFYTDEEILLCIADSTTGGYISQTSAEGYTVRRFNKNTSELNLANISTVSNVKASYSWGYIPISISASVDEMGNALNVFATKYDKINQANVSTLAPTKRWITRFVKAGTYVKEFSLQIAAQSMDYVSAEIWETSDGTTYTRSRQLAPVSVEPMTNQYKLTFSGFTVEKDGFICTYDTSSAGQARYVSLSGSDVLYFNKTAESITVSGMSILGNASVCYQIEAYEPIDNTSGDSSNIVTVKQDGTGTYTTIIEAMGSEPEGTPIYVYPGVYEQDMTACLKKRIILIGTDRHQCVIRDTDGRYDHHPLYVSCGYFENLTIESVYVSGTSQEIGTDNGSYAVHIDNDNDYGIGKQIEFHHCNIKSDFFPAVGCGLRKDLTLILDDCNLENGQIEGRGKYTNVGTLGALYFHDTNGEQGNQYAFIKDCVLTSKLAKAMCIYQVDREPQNNRVYCDFINNVLYSEVGKYTDTVYLRNDPFNANTGIFSIGIGYGNSVATINNN